MVSYRKSVQDSDLIKDASQKSMQFIKNITFYLALKV